MSIEKTQDVKFSLWVSAVFLLPVLPQLGLLLMILFAVLFRIPYDTRALAVAARFFIFFGCLFAVSVYGVSTTLNLARKKNIMAKKLITVFLLPQVFNIYALLDSIVGTITADAASEAGLGLMILFPVILFSCLIFGRYYALIRHRVCKILDG